MKGDIATNLVSLPTGQFVFLLGHHAIGIVKLQIGDPTHALLMVRGIEQMRKEALLQFGLIEGAWKGREWHGQETQRVDEFEGSALEGQDFGPHRQLVCHLALWLVQLVQNKHAIEPFQIVKDHENLPLVIPVQYLGEIIQIVQKLQGTVLPIQHITLGNYYSKLGQLSIWPRITWG